MPPRDGEVFAVSSLTGQGRRRGAWLATTGFVFGLVVLVGAGVLGRLGQPPQRAEPTALPTPAASTRQESSPSGDGVANGFDQGQSGVIALPQAGYEVAYVTDATHQPLVFDDGALAVFGFGERAVSGAYDGTIYVSVGTPARSAAILGHAGLVEVSGSTLDELEASYLLTGPGRILDREPETVDGAPALTFAIDAGAAGLRATALVVHGNRAFVVMGSGFAQAFSGPQAVAAQSGLQRFLEGFRFGTSLFVSPELGFQVPLPIQAKPFGAVLDVPVADAHGLYVFSDGQLASGQLSGDGRRLYSIGVSVGTQANPALVRVLPSGVPVPSPRRIWSASLVGLQTAYLGAIGGTTGSASTIELGGELGLIIEHPDGLARVVLAIHHGRDYILSTTGLNGPVPAPDFESFLAGFAFLD